MKTSPPIVQRCYDLCREILSTTGNIPKTVRYTVWEKAAECAVSLLRDLLAVTYMPPETRAAKLAHLSPNLDLLRMLIRLAYETRAIPQKRYVELQKIADEVGRMLGGWIRHSGK